MPSKRSDKPPPEVEGPGAEEFEDDDVQQEPEATVESLGGLAESPAAFASLTQARDEPERHLIVDPSEAVLAMAPCSPWPRAARRAR